MSQELSPRTRQNLSLLCLLPIALCVLYLLGAIPGFGKSSKTRYALLIGSEEKSNQNPVLYRAATVGPNQIAQVLRQEWGASARNIEILTPETEQKPTRANILAALQRLEKQADEDDEVLIYFMGHGMQTRDEDYFLPAGVSVRDFKQVTQQMISRSEVKASASRMKAAKVLTIFEKCRVLESLMQGSRAEVEARLRQPTPPKNQPAWILSPRFQASKRQRVTIFSCSVAQVSAVGGDSNGFFQTGFQTAFQGLGAQNYGAISLEDALDWMRLYTFASMRLSAHQNQLPHAVLDEGDLETAKKWRVSRVMWTRDPETSLEGRKTEQLLQAYGEFLHGQKAAAQKILAQTASEFPKETAIAREEKWMAQAP